MISSLTSSGREACMSILLSTGTIARSLPDGQVGVGHGLRLDALRGVHQQDRPFAGRQAARNLVMEVDVAGGVDQVQLVDLAVERVIDRDRPGLDGDPALALQVHVVEQLLAKLALGDRPRLEQELVGQRALAVVDVGDDREIADELGIKGHATCPVALGKPSGRNDAARKTAAEANRARVGPAPTNGLHVAPARGACLPRQSQPSKARRNPEFQNPNSDDRQ